DSAARMRIDLTGNQIGLKGRIGARDSLGVALDTGASDNVLDTELAAELGLRVRQAGESRGAGGVVRSGATDSVTFELPGLTLRDTPFGVIPLRPVAAPAGRRLDVVVGYPLISRCPVVVDYAESTVTFLRASPTPAQGATVLPLTFTQ